jgi:ribosomal protein L11 methylase PrmA
VFANILFAPLYNLTPVFKYIIKPNSFLILSGLLKKQIPYIINRYNNFGFIEEKKIILEDWGSIIMSLKS